MTPLEWLMGGDVGTSSETLLAGAVGLKARHPSVPLDPSDFGRCFRLVAAVPEVKDNFARVVEAYPMWAPYIAKWDAMSQAYARADGAEKSEDRSLAFGVLDTLLTAARKEAQGLAATKQPRQIVDRHMQQVLYHMRQALNPSVPYVPGAENVMAKAAYDVVRQELILAYAHLFEAVPGWMTAHGEVAEPAKE